MHLFFILSRTISRWSLFQDPSEVLGWWWLSGKRTASVALPWARLVKLKLFGEEPHSCRPFKTDCGAANGTSLGSFQTTKIQATNMFDASLSIRMHYIGQWALIGCRELGSRTSACTLALCPLSGGPNTQTSKVFDSNKGYIIYIYTGPGSIIKENMSIWKPITQKSVKIWCYMATNFDEHPQVVRLRSHTGCTNSFCVVSRVPWYPAVTCSLRPKPSSDLHFRWRGFEPHRSKNSVQPLWAEHHSVWMCELNFPLPDNKW